MKFKQRILETTQMKIPQWIKYEILNEKRKRRDQCYVQDEQSYRAKNRVENGF